MLAEQKEARKYKIMIADDAAATRRGTRLMLALNSMVEVVAIAKDGLQAVRAVKDTKVDIALIDIYMPGMDGISAIKHLLQNWPDLVCIVISSERSSEMLRRAMSVGARGYLIKPFTTEELYEAIVRAGRIIEGGRQRAIMEDRVRQERDRYAQCLAREYAKTRRTDKEAVQVYEYLASRPDCEPKWLRHLAMLYVLRSDWKKLRGLAWKLEKRFEG